LEVVAELRKRGAKIGSTTGYLSEMMKINREDAKRQGYEPDSTVCASDVPAGRPYPYMCLQNAINLKVTTVQACVKVDDTVPGVEEGLNAGMWTVGLSVSGNEVGLPLEQWQQLPEQDKAVRRSPHAAVRSALRRRYDRGTHSVHRRHSGAHPSWRDTLGAWRQPPGN
jgi:phosphonoacetaldehyde hydrolase